MLSVNLSSLCMCVCVCMHVIESSCYFITGNTPPLITGPTMLRLNLNTMASLQFNITDDKNMFNITIIGGLPDGANLMPTIRESYTEYLFSWTITSMVTRSLMFEARDELNASAVLSVQLQICACRNSSDCTIEGIVDTAVENVQLNCECSEGMCVCVPT